MNHSNIKETWLLKMSVLAQSPYVIDGTPANASQIGLDDGG